jgi:phage virion morphogenesis protein
MNDKLITEEISEKLGNTEPLMLNISRIMKSSVMKNFAAESDGKRRWARLAHSTRKQRNKKGYTGKILQRTGQLKNSVVTRHTNNTAEVGTNLKYAAIQNYGGVIHRTSLSVYLKKKRKGKNPHRPKKNRMATIRIPARPFLVLRKEYLDDVKDAIVEYLKGE